PTRPLPSFPTHALPILPVAQYHYPFENQDVFKTHFPADYISEAIDQTRGWFFSLHAIATMLFDQPAFKNVVCTSFVVDKQGRKIDRKSTRLNSSHLVIS